MRLTTSKLDQYVSTIKTLGFMYTKDQEKANKIKRAAGRRGYKFLVKYVERHDYYVVLYNE